MYKVGIITSSDKGSQGLREDKGGPKIREILEQFADDFTTAEYTILPDEKDQLAAEMIRMADDLGMDLIITTGGTGFSKRDVTPEATLSVITRRTPGIPEAMRSISLAITMRAMLSRAEAGDSQRFPDHQPAGQPEGHRRGAGTDSAVPEARAGHPAGTRRRVRQTLI